MVGDTSQLSPYTDDEEISMQVEACIVNEDLNAACVDAFMAHTHGKTVVVSTLDADVKGMYEKQCRKLGVKLHDVDEP